MSEKIIVEIGAGRFDIGDPWQPTIVARTLQADERYFGIDVGARSWPFYSPQERRDSDAAMRQKWQSLQTDRVRFVQADGRALPFGDGVVDEVVADNILGGGITDDEILRGVFRQACRVLKPDGLIAVHDSMTPRFPDESALSRWWCKQDMPGVVIDAVRPDTEYGKYKQAADYFGFRNRFGNLDTMMTGAGSGGMLDRGNSLFILRKSDPSASKPDLQLSPDDPF